MKNRIPLLALVLITLSATQGILFLTSPTSKTAPSTSPKHSTTPAAFASSLSQDPPNNLSWANGPDQFTTTFNAFPASRLSYQLSNNKTTLQLQYILNGTNMPNTTNNVGIALFWPSAAACISSFGTVTSGSGTGGGFPYFGPLLATVGSCQSYTRQGITRILSGFDSGILSLDSRGSGSLNVTISNLPSGAFQAELYVRMGTCTCAVILQSPGPTWGGTDSTVLLSTASSINILATGAPIVNPYGIALSKDGTKLFVTDIWKDSVLTFPATGGPATVLASGSQLVNTRGITVSPDGSTLFIAGWANDTIISLPSAGGTPTLLASGSPFISPSGITISPDGSKLYVSDTGAAAIFSLPVAGGTPTTIASGLGGTQNQGVADVKVSPDGSTLFFVEYSAGVFSLPATGGTPTLIALPPAGLNTISLALSPDGKTLYVLAFDPAFSGHPSVIFRIPTSGGTLTPLLSGPPLSVGGDLTLSHDGSLLYVVDIGYDYRYGIGPVGEPGLVFSLTLPTSCCNPPAGLVGWWPGEGTASDIAGTNNGNLVNGASFAPGIVGQAFSFNGTNQYVDLGNGPSLQVSHGNFTVDAWVAFNSVSGDMSILDKMASSGTNQDGWRLLKQADNRFWLCLGGGSSNLCNGGPPNSVASETIASTDVWYNVVAVKTTGTISIYVDGNLEGTTALGAFTDTNSANLLIGATHTQGSTAFLNGLVDEPEVYNRALTAAEIQAIFHVGSFGKCRAFKVYVTNYGADTVSVINGATNALVATVNVGPLPVWPAFDPINNEVYVPNFGTNTVSVISGGTDTVVSTISVGSNPHSVAIDLSNNDIYVSNWGSSTVSVINGTSNLVIATVGVGAAPEGVAFDPTNNEVYVANSGGSTLSVISGLNNTIVAGVNVGYQPVGVAFDSSNGDLYVANYGAGGGSTVSVIDGSTNNVAATVNVGTAPAGVTFDPSTSNVYVTNHGSNTVSVIRDSDNSVTGTVNVLIGPSGLAFDPSNNDVYVANSGESGGVPNLSVINDRNNTVISTLAVGAQPTGVTVAKTLAAAAPSFDFNLAAPIGEDTVLRGASARYRVTLTTTKGTPQPVTLTVLSGLPSGASASFTSNPLSPPGSSNVTISTSLGGGLGDFSLELGAGSGFVGHITTLKLHIYDFNVTTSLCQQTVLRGGIAPFNLTFALVAGSSTVNVPPINITAIGLPLNTTIQATTLPPSPVPIQFVALSFTPVTVQVLLVTHANTSLGDFPFSMGGLDVRVPEGGSRLVNNCAGGFQFHTFYVNIPWTCAIGTGGTVNGYINANLAPGSSTINLPPVILQFTGLPTGSTVRTISRTAPFTIPCSSGFSLPGGYGGSFGLAISGNIGGAGGGTIGGSPPGGQPGQTLTLHVYDFQVIIPPETVMRGQTIRFNVTIALLPGSSTVNLPSIYLNVSGLPLGITGYLSPTSGTFAPLNGTLIGFTSLLTLQIDPTTPLGNYTFNITGNDTRPLLGGIRTGNGMLRIVPLGDVNGDGKVNIFDLVAVATAFGSHPGDPNWNPACDLNGDGVINIFDLVTVAANFGQGT